MNVLIAVGILHKEGRKIVTKTGTPGPFASHNELEMLSMENKMKIREAILEEKRTKLGQVEKKFECIKTLINRKTLLAMIPLSDRAIFNMEKRGDFPRRIVLTSRNVAWDLAEVEKWIESRKESEDQPIRPGININASR